MLAKASENMHQKVAREKFHDKKTQVDNLQNSKMWWLGGWMEVLTVGLRRWIVRRSIIS